MRRGLSFLAAFVLIAASPSRPSVDTVFDSLQKTRGFRGVAISPDGTRVAWAERVKDREGADRLSAIFLADVASPAPRRITAGRDGKNHREHGMAFSPDGRSLAFLSDAEKERQLQICVAPVSGGPVRQITKTAGQVSALKWSPDGKTIAFLFVAGSDQEPGALVAYKPHSGVVEEKVEEQRIAVADAVSGRVREISPADLYVYDYDWSPDGKSFAAEAAPGSGTDNYWIAQLYIVGAESGQARSIWKPPLQIAAPRFAPDGKSVAVIHGIMSDEGSTGGDIDIVPAAGGPVKNLTPGMKASATALFWRSPGEIVLAEHVDGNMGLAALDPSSGEMKTLWSGPEVLSGFAVARTANASVAVRSSFLRPAEVWAGATGTWKQITRGNEKAERFWGEARSLHWQSGGARVQGWLLFPRDFDAAAGKLYPMVVSVHGGPAAASTPSWPSRWNAVLPSQGYFLFLPNPRGSYGQGEAFAQGNVKDFGHGDFADILAGVDEVLRTAPVNGERLGIVGWSYGGYMTMWAVTQTNRFKAAVAGAGIANWQSYYGQNRIDRWMEPYFGKSVYEDPAVYAKSSPIEFIQKAKTPTLVLHGDRDSEVPTPQGYEFWHALKTLAVPTQFVVYENEGHGISKPDHQRDIERRTVAWFDKYLK